MTLTKPPLAAVPDEPSDDLGPLVGRVGSGDVEAFAALYDATAAAVFGLALNVLGDEDLAADVARQTFAEVWRSAPHYTAGHGPADAWIVATGHRLAVAQVRTGGSAVPVGPHTGSPLLDDLPAEESHALRLTYFGGQTYAEVARTTGVTDGVVVGRLGSALRAIRTATRRDVA
ncbi:RNA polymerase sigma factor [Nocardioides okcheonensis]|uniref:RNA polymerase sigma factor n=1 Tax=Nocardioides okcheonensis TaxID=2894081 RepID=UPI001E56839D|nr:sigma factor [Nocardioides okcheonensis]UFN44499.1 hypothetical protein LN652_21055 [Nocardioides okcheonensis]